MGSYRLLGYKKLLAVLQFILKKVFFLHLVMLTDYLAPGVIII